jgi:choline dehydrogenase
VGGGTAGLTVANRLAKHNSVAVIEAGGFYEIENANFTQVPGNDVYYVRVLSPSSRERLAC